MVLPAELIYEMPVPAPGQIAPSPYAQPTTALIGYAVYLSIGQPLHRYLLEVSFESEEIDIWTPNYETSSVSYDRRRSSSSSDTVWFGWRPVRMPVRYSPEAGPSEACPRCSGRLGLARGSSWWLRFPQIHFRANSISLGDVDDKIGGGTHVASVRCEEDVRDTLCAVREGAIRIGHGGVWHGNGTMTVRFSLHRPTMVLPREAYTEFNEDLRNKHALFTHTVVDGNASSRKKKNKTEKQFFPSIYVKIGSEVTLRMDKDELLAHSDEYHEHLHVALSSGGVDTQDTREIHLSAALLHSFSVTMNRGEGLLILHAHAVRDHLGYWSLVFVLLLSYLLVRWIVTDTWIHHHRPTTTQRMTTTTEGSVPLYKRVDFFSFLYEAVGIVLSLVVLIYTGVSGVLEDEPTLYGLLGGTMLSAIAMEMAADVVCKTTETSSDSMTMETNMSTARLNIVRSSAHKYVLGSALWMAFAARSQDGVDSFISLSISYYVLFSLLYYALWSVQFVIITESLGRPTDDDDDKYTRRSRIVFYVYLAAVSPALIGIGVFVIYHYLSIPFMRRQLLEYYDISRVLSLVGLILVVPTAGAVAYIYTRKHIRRALFDEMGEAKVTAKREAVLTKNETTTQQQYLSPDKSGMRLRATARS